MKFCVALSLVFMLSVASSVSRAANINWGSAQDVTPSAEDDIVDGGAVVFAFNGHNHNSPAGVPASVNLDGVTFTSPPISEFLGWTPVNGPAPDRQLGGQLNGNSTGNADYDTLLDNVAIVDAFTAGLSGTNEDAIYPINGLSADSDYLLQIWFTEERDKQSHRVAVFGDNAVNENTVDVAGAGGNGFGKFVIGEFTADSGTQDLRLGILFAGRSHVTGLLVREAVPEPSAFILVAASLVFLLAFRHSV